jgi:hypothetical protein
VAACVLPAQAGARATDAGGTYIESFADTGPAVTTAGLTLDIAQIKALYCAAQPERGNPSQAAALAEARRLVSADSHGRGLKAAAGKPGRSEGRSIASAVAALGAGKPAAALAALLRAHQLAPSDPVPLVDAAPLLSQAGKGRSALALLAAAAHLRAPKTHPFGLTWKTMIAANRGQAQVVAHQYAAAERTLTAVLRQSPLIVEADKNLAVAYACQGKSAKATRYLVFGATRQTFSKGDYIGRTPITPYGAVNPAEVLDTKKGVALTLPAYRYPATMDEGRAQKLTWISLSSQATSAQSAAINAERNDQTALVAQLAKASAATRLRTQQIIAAIEGAASEPDLVSEAKSPAELQGELSRLQLRGYGQGGCIDGGLHGTFQSTVTSYDHAERAYASDVYRRMTGLAANLKNPTAHQLGIDYAREFAAEANELLLSAGTQIAEYDDICDPNDNSPGSENPQTSGGDTPASDPCPTGIAAPNVYISLFLASLNVSCETVTVEVDFTEGLIGAFVGGTHNFANGSNTIYAGAEAGLKTPAIGSAEFQAGPSARAGIYTTFGADGSVQDVGVRASSQLSLGITQGQAGGTYAISGPSVSFGFVGGLTTSY